MKPVFQTKFTEGEQRGNCVAAVFASFLEIGIDDLPKFEECETDDDVREIDEALEKIALKAGWAWLGSCDGPPPNDGQYYPTSMFVAVEGIEIRHLVIMKDGVVVHDPRGDRALPLGEIHSHYLFSRLSGS